MSIYQGNKKISQVSVYSDTSDAIAAEVAQARVDFDGTGHNTLKARLDADFNDLQNQITTANTEISDVKEDLTALGVTSETTKVVSLGTQTQGAYTSNGTIDESSNSSRCTEKLDISGATIIYYSGALKFGAMFGVVFFNSNNEVVGTALQGTATQTQYTDEPIIVPKGAVKVGLSFYNVDPTLRALKAKFYNVSSVKEVVKSEIGELTKYSVDGKYIGNDFISGKYVDMNGILQTHNSYWTSGIISCENVLYYKYNGFAKWGVMYGYIFIDENDNIIDKGIVGTSTVVQYINELITVPSGAVKVAFNFLNHGASEHRFIEYHKEIVGTLDDRIGAYKRYKGKKWVCVGDSLTQNNSATNKHYFDYISDELGFEIVNMGVGGTGYMRGNEENNAFYQRISDCPSDADIVTIFGSGNDLALFDRIGEYTDTTTDTICGCVNTTLNGYFAICPTAPIGIIAPCPWLTCPTTSVGNSMELYTEKLRKIAEYRGVPFLDLYHCSNLRPEDETNRNACFYNGTSLDGNGDGVHPNELGHKIIASKIREFVLSLIIN